MATSRVVWAVLATLLVLLAGAFVLDLIKQRAWIDAGVEKAALLGLAVLAGVTGVSVYRRSSK